MIDIHSHFLFGVDDGSNDESQTRAMLKQAADSGITDLVATPHVNETSNQKYFDQINKNFDDVEEIIKEENLNLKIHRGSEIILDSRILEWLKFPDLLFGNEQKYLLFELPLFFDFQKVSDIIFELALQKITPILAHPERSIKLQESPEILLQWLGQGSLMQMNAGSILGHFGKKAQRTSKKFLKSGLIQFIASDAHETRYRNYSALKDAYNQVSGNFSVEFADILFKENPRILLNGGKVTIFPTDKEKLKNLGLHQIIEKIKSIYS